MYFAVGTVTNSGVVGVDNAYYGWLGQRPAYHDVPARDIILAGQNFPSDNPLTKTNPNAKAITGAFHPFGTPSFQGEIIRGELLANGVVYRANPDGSGLSQTVSGIFLVLDSRRKANYTLPTTASTFGAAGPSKETGIRFTKSLPVGTVGPTTRADSRSLCLTLNRRGIRNRNSCSQNTRLWRNNRSFVLSRTPPRKSLISVSTILLRREAKCFSLNSEARRRLPPETSDQPVFGSSVPIRIPVKYTIS